MITALLLIGAICSAEGPDKICTYADVTEAMEIESDDHCFAVAQIANDMARERPDTPLYACIPPEQYLALLDGSEPIKLKTKPEIL